MPRNRTTIIAFAVSLTTVSIMAQAAAAYDAAYARPQQRVVIDGNRALNLYCAGSGSPTVIFDSGLSDWSFTWALVQPRVARLTRACSYDRAGLGYSDPARRAGTSANMVDDLQRLLRAAQIAPPYLLIGHSLGGFNVRLFADRHPDQVAGMVLVDSAHEDGFARIDAQHYGVQSRHYGRLITRARNCLRHIEAERDKRAWRSRCVEPNDARYSAKLNSARETIARTAAYQRAQLSETVNFANDRSAAAVRTERRYYGAIPLIVLTAAASVDEIGPIWLEMQTELAALSGRGVQETVGNAGHYIQLDQPDSVINAIDTILKQARYPSESMTSTSARDAPQK